jgi:hypothetical protein
MGFGSFLKSSLKEQLGSWDDFSDGFKEGFFGNDYFRDYKHGSKVFVADGHALAPTNKFLFHVYFTLNTAEIPELAKAMGGAEGSSRIGMLVKTVKLPTFNFEVEEMNQYNRKRYIQKKINYRPVNITFHDDGSDTIRSMWYNYYNYYYNDPSYGYDGQGSNNPSYNDRDIYDNFRPISDWGFSGSGPNGYDKPAFFKDIKIYGLNRGNFTSYTLINPIITDWDHDTFDYSAGSEVMQHSMSISYETVKYGRGKVGAEVKGFGDSAVYDTSPSPLRAGSTASLFGRGGILDSGNSILDDLASGNILGAIRTGGSLRNTLKGRNVGSLVASELVSGAISTGLNYISAGGANNGSGFSIPSLGGIGNLASNAVSGIGNMTSGLFSSSNFGSMSTLQISNTVPDLGNRTNSFAGVSTSANQLAQQFAPGTELHTNYTAFFNNMKASMEPGMAVAEKEMSNVASSISTNIAPSITNLQDGIPSADSLKQIASNAGPALQNAQKTFAPVAQSISQQMQKLVNSGEMKQMTNSFKNAAGNVVSNGSNIGL